MSSISLNLRVFILLLLITIGGLKALFSQENASNPLTTDSVPIFPKDSITILNGVPKDSTQSDETDSLNQETKIDTTISKDAIKSRVDYKAADSLRIDMSTEKVYLFGNAQVNYENIQLNADYIEVDLANNTVIANGIEDSLGEMVGLPVFKEGAQTYEAGKMTYNFDTKKGKIQEIKTQEGDGFIKGNEVKKTGGDVMYVRNGYYTTCSLDDPHFSLATSKLKVIPNDKIVTGPTVLKIDDVPTPLGLPFGFFPNKKGRSSGIIVPTYGDSRNLGFFLRDGGFYFGMSDNIDLALTADVYSLGSWGTRLTTRYANRYHYNGNFNASFARILNSFPEFPDYSESNEFFVRWNHQQDPKARPGSRFSANVNLGTVTNFQRNLNSFDGDYLTNTFQSSISYSNSFPTKPYNLTLSARHDQNTRSRRVNLSVPDVAFNVSRIYPFKNSGAIGNEWWRSIYKNLGISYSGTATNKLSAIDTTLAINRFSEIVGDMRNGVRHNIPIATSFKMFKYFNLNPSISYTELWTIETYDRRYDPISDEIVRDTVNGFRRGGNYSFNTNMTTTIYGMYQFRKGKVQAIRHVMRPQVSFNYRPEIRTGVRSFLDGNNTVQEYSIYEGGVYGRPDQSKSGRLGFNMQNNIEMKVRSSEDSTGSKKITLFENIGFNTSYDLEADSLAWAPITANARTRIGQFFTLQFDGRLNPYAFDSTETGFVVIDRSNKSVNGNLLRLTSANIALNFRLQGGKKNKKNKNYESEYGTDEELEAINANPEQYIDFSIPWSFNMNYNIRYSKPFIEEAYTQTLNFSGDLSLTTNWKLGFNSGWDFESRDFTYTSVNINRDLHCWQMAINWIPYGPRQSYMLTINVKSPVLQDLKLNRRRDYFDTIR